MKGRVKKQSNKGIARNVVGWDIIRKIVMPNKIYILEGNGDSE